MRRFLPRSLLCAACSACSAGFVVLNLALSFWVTRAEAQNRAQMSQQQLLAEMSKQVDWRKADPQEALMAAAALDNQAQAERALKRGAKINQPFALLGHTPLISGAQKPTLNMMKFLVAKGADVNGRSAASHLSFPLRLSRHILQPAARPDDLNSQVEETLAYMSSVPPHWRGFRSEGAGITPLIAAAATGSAQKVRYLLDKGAKVNLATDSGETALMAAAYVGYLPAVEELLKAGAKINATNYRGYSALSFAVLEGRTEVARTLLHRGADSNVKMDGYTLPQIAQGFKYKELAIMLARHNKWQQSLAKKKALQAKQNAAEQTPSAAPDKRGTVKIIHSDGSVEVVR